MVSHIIGCTSLTAITTITIYNSNYLPAASSNSCQLSTHYSYILIQSSLDLPCVNYIHFTGVTISYKLPFAASSIVSDTLQKCFGSLSVVNDIFNQISPLWTYYRLRTHQVLLWLTNQIKGNIICSFILFQDIAGYIRGCKFLPKLNNEIVNKRNSTYRQRFASLQNLILIMVR